MRLGEERCVIFLHESCCWQPLPSPPRPPCQAACEDLGVNAGFKSRFVSLCVCVCLWLCVRWRGSVGWVGWCQMGAGGRTVSHLSLKGGWTTRCISVHVWACVLCGAGCACRLCIGRGSSACSKVTKHTNAYAQITQLKEWKPFLKKELVRMSQIWFLSGYGIMYSEPYYACFWLSASASPLLIPMQPYEEGSRGRFVLSDDFLSSCLEE